MVSKFLNLDTDGTLTANDDSVVASQKAVKTYVDENISDLESRLPSIATANSAGLVKPDGETITVLADGTISASSGGGGSESNMKNLFGNGGDGGLTLSANTNFSEPKEFTTLTINEGVTLSHTLSSNALLLIRCTTACYINGIINMSGKGYQGGDANANEARYAAKGSALPVLWAGGGTNFPGGYPLGGATQGGFGAGSGGAGGSHASAAISANGGNFDITRHKYFTRQLIFDQMPLLGGGGAGVGSTSVAGGNGGGGILIFAPVISFGANAQIISNGNNGGAGNKTNSGGGGGGGGSATFVCKSCTGTPSTSFTGGAGGTSSSTFGSSYGNGGNGGTGGMVIVILPAGS